MTLKALLISSMIVVVGGCSRLSSEQKAKLLSQQLEIVWVVSMGGSSDIQLQGLSDQLYPKEINQLKDAGVKGTLYVFGAGEDGQGHTKRARVVVVMDKQIAGIVDLPQPDGTNIIYLKKGDQFEMLPKRVPILAATIRLKPESEMLDFAQPKILTPCTEYEIVREDGGTYGGMAFVWKNTIQTSY